MATVLVSRVVANVVLSLTAGNFAERETEGLMNVGHDAQGIADEVGVLNVKISLRGRDLVDHFLDVRPGRCRIVVAALQRLHGVAKAGHGSDGYTFVAP